MDLNLDDIRRQFEDSARIQQVLGQQFSEKVLETARLMIDSLKHGGKLLICGNGGSAADSQHFAAEMIGRFLKDREPLPAIALSTDTSILTAVGNDYSFADVFKKQVEALGQAGDVLIGMSTSGHSENVIRAVEAAKKNEMPTILLLGKDGGKLAAMADHAIVVPSNLSQRIQEGHITIIHIWCDLIESAIFPDR